MDNRIIVYGSEYGHTEKYVKELAQHTKIEAVSFDKINDINLYDVIVYIGALYAGGVKGMKKTFAKIKNNAVKKIIIVTVGLADPTDAANIDHIRCGIKNQLSKEIYEKAHIYHLRGGIDYSELSIVHKTMMGLLYKKACNLPEEEKTAEVKAMIETYNKKVDFTNFESLVELEKEL